MVPIGTVHLFLFQSNALADKQFHGVTAAVCRFETT
jgi:hypothetical protein